MRTPEMYETDSNKKVCGTCRFNRRNVGGEFACSNRQSEEYMVETEYDYSCNDWEEK